MRLTAEQNNKQWAFERMGYLVVRQAVAPELVQQLRSRIAEVHVARRKSTSGHVRKLYGIYDEAPELFNEVFESAALRDELRNILGSECGIHQESAQSGRAQHRRSNQR